MKIKKLQFTIVAICCLIYSTTVKAQVTYDFDSATPLTGVTSQFSSTLEAVAGTATIPTLSGNTTNVIHPLVWGASNTGVADLDNFPTTDADCNVTWKEYITVGSVQYKKGVVLRGNGQSGYTVGNANPTVVTGLKQGYYFMVQNNVSGSVTFRIFNVSSETTLTQLNPSAGGIAVGVTVGAPIWYRASVVGSTLKMEYSTDGTTFTTGEELTDTTHSLAGGTQLFYGIGNGQKDYYFDDIVYKAGAPTLGMPSLNFEERSIVVFKKNNTININSTEMSIKSVELFDLNGRVLASKNNVNALETSFSNLNFARGIILVKITGAENRVVVRKLVN